jgi:hypothetical protein
LLGRASEILARSVAAATMSVINAHRVNTDPWFLDEIPAAARCVPMLMAVATLELEDHDDSRNHYQPQLDLSDHG